MTDLALRFALAGCPICPPGAFEIERPPREGNVAAFPADRAGLGGGRPGADPCQRVVAIVLLAWLPTAVAASWLPATESAEERSAPDAML